MSFIFGKQKEPSSTTILQSTPEKAVDTQALQDAATEKAKADELERRKKAKGRNSTILTGGEGDTSVAPTLSKTLLGE